MRKRHIHLLIISAVIVLGFALVSTNLPASKVFAMQQGGTNQNSGSTGSGTNSGATGDTGQGSGSQGGTTQGGGQSSGMQGTNPGSTGSTSTPNQAGSDAGTGPHWGSLILGFITGMIVGGLLFRNRGMAGRDRENLRRAG